MNYYVILQKEMMPEKSIATAKINIQTKKRSFQPIISLLPFLNKGFLT